MKHINRLAFISLSLIAFNSLCFASKDACKNIDQTTNDYNTLINMWPNKKIDNNSLSKCLKTNNPASGSCTLHTNVSKFINMGCKNKPIAIVTQEASIKDKNNYTHNYNAYKDSLKELTKERNKEEIACKNISLSAKDSLGNLNTTSKNINKDIKNIKIELNKNKAELNKQVQINNKLKDELSKLSKEH